MIKKLQLDLLMYIPIRFYTSFGIIKLISQISQISRDIHAYNIAPRDILKVRYLLHPTLVSLISVQPLISVQHGHYAKF